MSYGAAFGSNGERDYMRQVALDALARIDAAPVAQEGEQGSAQPTPADLRDAERLNFIESRHLVLDPCESEYGIRCYEVNEILGDEEDDSKRTLGSGKTAREAIDAARAAHLGEAPTEGATS